MRKLLTGHILFSLAAFSLTLSFCSSTPPSSADYAATIVTSTVTATRPAPVSRTPSAPVHHAGFAGSFPLANDKTSGIVARQIVVTGGNFVRLALDPLSQQLYYMDMAVNIYRLTLKPGKDSTGQRAYSAADVGQLTSALGMTFGPDGTLYVVGNVAQGDLTRAIVRKGVPNSQGVRVWRTVLETEPYPLGQPTFDHIYNGLAVSPDGKYLFIAAGSRTDHGEVEAHSGKFPDTREVPLTSAIFRVPIKTENLRLPADEAGLKPYLFADGLRNAFDLAFGPTGDLFAGDNGPDADYPDELNWIQAGHHYGFPWRFANQDNPQQFPNYDPAQDVLVQKKTAIYANDPKFPPPPTTFTDPIPNLGPDAVQFRDQEGQRQDAAKLGGPLYSFTPHRSPLGLVFDNAHLLPKSFKGHAFILSWGAALSNFTDKGQDLLDLNLTKAGSGYQMTATQIMTGFRNPIDAVLFEGRLYVLDFGKPGGIWEITFPAEK